MGAQGGGGGGGSASQGYDYQAQLQQALETVWGPQGDALQGMYSGASALANQQSGQIGAAAQGMVDQSMGGMQSGISTLQELAAGGGPLAGLAAGDGALAQYAQPNNALAQQQLGQYSQQVGQEFGRNILPQIRSGAGLTGNMGGSRAALAQGVAAGDASRAIAQGGTDLYAQQYGIGAQAASALSQQRLGAAQSLSQQRLGAAAALPEAATAQYNLGMQPWAAQWAPFSSLAGILGSATTLTGSQSYSMGESWNSQKGNATKPSFGFNLM